MVTESDNCVWNGVGEMQGEKGSLLGMKRSGKRRTGGWATGKGREDAWISGEVTGVVT